MSSKFSESSASIALFVIRIVAGLNMILNHGWKKLSSFESISAKGFADPFGIGTTASLSLAIFAEVGCSALLILGLFTRLATIPLMVTMFVAIFVAHGGDFFGEGEMAALYLAAYFALFVAGPGKYSLDRKIGKN